MRRCSISPVLVVAVAAAGMLLAAAPGDLAGQSLKDTIPVFRVVSYDCKGKPEDRAQSGVVVQGIQGIVTALHGVVGCAVRATWRGGTFGNLEVALVDVAHDLAVLRSHELDAALRSGALRPQQTASPPPSQKVVYVVGFPGLVQAHVMDLLVDSPDSPLRGLALETDAGDALLALLLRRRSPDVDIRLVSLVGPMQPGHSGAPVVDSAGRVFALGNGGFLDRSIAWAIPVQPNAMTLVPASTESIRLDRLATDPESAQLFSFATTHVRPLAFRPSLSVAGLIGDSGRDWQLRYRIPVWKEGRRVSGIFAVGAQQAEFTQSLSTLAGVEAVPTTETSTRAYIAIGLDYRLRLLPDQLVDPYVRMSVGHVLEKGLNPRLDAAVGFDLFVTSFARTFLEATVVGARLERERYIFTRLGSPTTEKSKVWVRSFGATLGIGLAVGARR